MMNTRRKFLIQGSMATTAVLALKPFASIAGIASPFTEVGSNSQKLFFLHTTGMDSSGDDHVVNFIKTIKDNNNNAILLHTGKEIQDQTKPFTYDVSFREINNPSAITGDYKIISRGKLRTGIISAKPEENNVIQKINTLSAFLKKEKNCNLVVCLSSLGYKNKYAPDDLTLAKKSNCLDMVIGGHTNNFHQHPVIALNSNEEEVIIHSSSGNQFACGVIQIDFDGKGQKKLTRFSDLSKK